MLTPIRFTIAAVFGGLIAATPLVAADPPKTNELSEKKIEEGWIDLFDGETTFGWKVEGDAKVEGGVLVVGGPNETRLTTTTFLGAGDLHVLSDGSDRSQYEYQWLGQKMSGNAGEIWTFRDSPNNSPSPLVVVVAAGRTSRFTAIRYKPGQISPLFNNKDLTGWKVFDADPAKVKAKFEVTPDGDLSVTGGPGDIQTEAKYADFVLQTRAKTNRTLVNSGIFFRCIPGEFQNGYELQINNAYLDNDRAKPLDFGTGAIYRRVKARKVVSTDNEWFTLTLIANGPHFSTWVNGYQTVDWTDDRKPDPNPRKGLRTEAGPLSIQGHAPPTTADLLFRSIKIAELKAGKK